MFEKFIKATDTFCDLDAHVPAPYIRRGFRLDFLPAEAEILIAVSGFYELYVNGKNITKGYIAPYISNPDDMIFYDRYDITEYLNEGDNAVGVILGNGFANQCTDKWDFSKASFRAPLCMSLDLSASGDGRHFTLSSDESFKVHPSHIVFDMYRYGTHVDGSLEVKGWSSPDFDDYSWHNAAICAPPRGKILPCTASPIRKICEIRPIRIEKQENICYLKTRAKGGEDISSTRTSGYLYDFGKSIAGVVRLKISGERGRTIKLRHCERLSDGCFNINSIYTMMSDYERYIDLLHTDVYTLSGEGEEIFVPSFTYHGFRYVLVEGITDTEATEELLTCEVLSSDVERRADFSSSSETLNTLYEMAIRADVSNMHYFPTDCPHREKNGWTGDISVSAEQLLRFFDCKAELKLWLKMLAASQREDGSLPGIVPTSGWGFAWGNGPMWDSASVTVPYYIYKYDGDTDVLFDSSDMIYKYLMYVSGRRDERGLVAIGLGDWCEPRESGAPITAPLVLTDSVTVYDIARKSAKIFEIIGDDERREYALRLASEMRSAVREHLIDMETMLAVGNCQTSQTIIISHGIVDDGEEETEAYRQLIRITHEKGDFAFCGMIGLRYIFEVLATHGDIDLALRMITREEEPSYGSMIKRGATSLCEATMENGLNESENHHFLGDIIRIFHAYIAGLRVNPYMCNPNECIFSPVIPCSVDHAYGKYRFATGEARFGWHRSDDGIVAHISLPKGVRCELDFGGERRALKEGENTVTVGYDRICE